MPYGDNIVYRVNDQDEIVYVNDEWDRFAEANEGEGVASSRVLHRPLWDFIGDSTTRVLYRQVLKQIREGRIIRFALRCDAPTCRRLLEMDITRGENGTVEFRTSTLSEWHRPAPIWPSPNAVSSDELLRVCGWCNKVKVDGAWEEVEQAIVSLRLFELPLLPSLTHGICDPCYRKMIERLAEP